jgi:nicotinamidase-related amidase
MKDALLLIDLFNSFKHEDGDALLDSYRRRLDGMVAALERARSAGIPVIYANDNEGIWDGDGPGLVRKALAGRGGALVRKVTPQEGDRFVVKPRYSAFDHTPLELILRELEIERLLLAGAATEMCVVQTAIDGRECGLKISVLADACATTDERLERISFEYLTDVVGVRVDRAQKAV